METNKFNKKNNTLIGTFGIIVILVTSFFFANPPGASPDELVHNAASWYTFEHGLPPTASRTVSNPLPTSLILDNNCYKFQREQDASCLPEKNNSMSSGYPMMTYAPIYYFVVGAGQHFSTLWGNEAAIIGGRLASALLNLLVLFFALQKTFRRNKFAARLAPIILTPMALFLIPTVNPSGFEFCTSILFTTTLFYYFKDYILDEKTVNARAKLSLFVTTILFGLARPSAIVWILIIFAVVFSSMMPLKSLLKTLNVLRTIFGIPFMLGVVFHLTHRHDTGSPTGYVPYDQPTKLFYFQGFISSMENFPKHLWESYGVLGWLDTPAPLTIVTGYFLLAIILATTIVKRMHLPKLTIAIMLFGVWPLISILEMLAWNAWPNWWQGRYSLPLLASSLWFLILNSHSITEKFAVKFSGLCILGASIVSLENLFRYSFGLQGYLPRRLVDPAVGDQEFFMSMFCIVACLSFGVYEVLGKKRFNGSDITA